MKIQTTHSNPTASDLKVSSQRAQGHLAHVFTAVAINLIRLDAWWTATPLGQTQTSHLTTLGASLAA
jgi:hypothetical protein